MSRAIFAAGALLASASLAQAGDHANFSPDLKDAPIATPALAPAVVAEAPPASRGRAARRRTRLAKARTPKAVDEAALKPSLTDGTVPLTIAAIPAPLPPVHDDAKVSDAVATLETPPVRGGQEIGGNIESASRTPHAPAVSLGDGPREAPSGTVAELLAKHAQANGVPLALAQAVVRIESRGNTHASNHGALGLMQIKYGTARAAGFSGSAMGLFVADTNLRYGMKVLGQAYKDAGGDTCGALMRYQSGHLATHMSRANRAYCSRARAFMAGA